MGILKPGGLVRFHFYDRAFNESADGLLKFPPKLHRMSLRMLYCIGAVWNIQTCDAIQAFVNSRTKLRTLMFVLAPPEMNLPYGIVLKVKSPLYGIPEWSLKLPSYVKPGRQEP